MKVRPSAALKRYAQLRRSSPAAKKSSNFYCVDGTWPRPVRDASFWSGANPASASPGLRLPFRTRSSAINTRSCRSSAHLTERKRRCILSSASSSVQLDSSRTTATRPSLQSSRDTWRQPHRIPLYCWPICSLCRLATLYLPLSLSPQRRKELVFECVINRITSSASRQPLLLVLEDAHWIDPTSRELFDVLVERIRGASVLLLVTYRPEFVPSWMGQSHVSVLTLNRLGPRESAVMIDRVAGRKTLLRKSWARSPSAPRAYLSSLKK